MVARPRGRLPAELAEPEPQRNEAQQHGSDTRQLRGHCRHIGFPVPGLERNCREIRVGGAQGVDSCSNFDLGLAWWEGLATLTYFRRQCCSMCTGGLRTLKRAPLAQLSAMVFFRIAGRNH